VPCRRSLVSRGVMASKNQVSGNSCANQSASRAAPPKWWRLMVALPLSSSGCRDTAEHCEENGDADGRFAESHRTIAVGRGEMGVTGCSHDRNVRYPQRYPHWRFFAPCGAALFRVFTLSGFVALWRRRTHNAGVAGYGRHHGAGALAFSVATGHDLRRAYDSPDEAYADP
jgi:hypothetical protein